VVSNTIDVIMAAVILAAAIVGISTAKVMADVSDLEAVYQATTEPPTEETTEAITKPTETETADTEPSVTEEAEPVTLYDVPLDEELQLYIISEAEAHGIDPAIIMAMAFRESNYDPGAIGDNGNSYGLLQVQERFHKERMQRLGCTDLLDPYQNVTVAIDFLCELLNKYGDMGKALTAYNRGHYAGTVTQYAKTILVNAEELGVIK
jgi:soluble lytic murein transglycosylase-like protein